MATFKQFLEMMEPGDNPEGDFVKDARRDSGFPDVAAWDDLKRYLTSKRADPSAIEAAETLWREYEASDGRSW